MEGEDHFSGNISDRATGRKVDHKERQSDSKPPQQQSVLNTGSLYRSIQQSLAELKQADLHAKELERRALARCSELSTRLATVAQEHEKTKRELDMAKTNSIKTVMQLRESQDEVKRLKKQNWEESERLKIRCTELSNKLTSAVEEHEKTKSELIVARETLDAERKDHQAGQERDLETKARLSIRLNSVEVALDETRKELNESKSSAEETAQHLAKTQEKMTIDEKKHMRLKRELRAAKKDATTALINAKQAVSQLAASQEEIKQLKEQIKDGDVQMEYLLSEVKEAKNSALTSERKAAELETDYLDMQAEVGRLQKVSARYRELHKLVSNTSRNTFVLIDWLAKYPDPDPTLSLSPPAKRRYVKKKKALEYSPSHSTTATASIDKERLNLTDTETQSSSIQDPSE